MTNEQIQIVLTTYCPVILSILSFITSVLFLIRKFKKVVGRYENNEDVKDLKKRTISLSATCNALIEDNKNLRTQNEALIKQISDLSAKQDVLIETITTRTRHR